MANLNFLAQKYKTDKFGEHYYTPIYEKFMREKRNKKIALLEIGVGGYQAGNYSNKYLGGESLKMWRDYFKYGLIIGLDIVKKKLDLGNRVKIHHGSQIDYFDLKKITNKYKKFDFIIDDGSHKYKDIVFSFKYLFNYLKPGGYYFIEDVGASSYIREFGGDGFNLNKNKTVINFFKSIVDRINHREIENPYYKKNYFDMNITEIHFYHNLIVVKKNYNKDKSTILIDNQRLVGGKSFINSRRKIKKIKYFFLYLKSRINLFLNYIIN